jgi:hypothetical protein
MKIAAPKVQSVSLNGPSFVPASAAERVGNRNMVFGSESFYSLAETMKQEAAADGSRTREDVQQSTTKTGEVL